MRLLLLFLLILSIQKSYTQNLPSDRLIITLIYGKVDNNKDFYTRPFKDEEKTYSYRDSVSYRIVFKKEISIQGQNLIFVITEANVSTFQGHEMGYRDFYYIKHDKNYTIFNSIVSEDESPLGDEGFYEIAKIGKNKLALITTFQSTGNHHYEKTKDIYSLTLSELAFLDEINEEYDNSASLSLDSVTNECEALRYQNIFTIVNDDKEWFDIKVHHIEYGFTKGCLDTFISKEYDKIHLYNEGKYIEK